MIVKDGLHGHYEDILDTLQSSIHTNNLIYKATAIRS